MIAVRTVYELLPFANTLYVLDLTRRQLRQALEELIRGQVVDGRLPAVYTAGLKFQINRRAPFGRRIADLQIKSEKGYDRVGPLTVYRIAVQDYRACVVDRCKTLKTAARYCYYNGLFDAEVFMEYLKQMPGGVVTD